MKNIILIIFVLFPVIFLGQELKTAKEVMEKVTNSYSKTTKLSYLTHYNLYTNYKDIKPKESYGGMILKNGEVNYCKIQNTEFISFKNCSVKVSHSEKVVLYSEGDLDGVMQSPVETALYLKEFKGILKTTPSHYICEFSPKKITQIMASKIIIYVDRKDLKITKQIMYLAQKMESKNSKGKIIETSPRIEISYQKRKSDDKKDSFLTSKESYFTKKGNDIVLAKRLLAYQLFKS